MKEIQTYSTRELSGLRVFGGKSGESRRGKIARFIFHPTKNYCLGFIVKRPDVALMFHRSDLFVPLESFELGDSCVVVYDEEKDAVGERAIKRLGLNWQTCVMWEGMPVVKETGEELGTVGDVVFSASTGKIISLCIERGSAAKTLLGQLVVPVEDIVGFRTGIGAELAEEWVETEDGQVELMRGAIVVSRKVNLGYTQGGVAQAAGEGAAKAQEKVRQATKSVKPKAEAAAKKTGEAVNKGAYATGKQLGRAKGMFSAFKEEYDKARGPKPAQKKKPK